MAEKAKIPEHFLTSGILSPSDIERVLEVSESTGQPVRMVLDRLGIVSQKLWVDTVSAAYDLPVIGISDFPPQLLRDDRLSQDYMKRNSVALLSIGRDGTPVIAIADPAERQIRQSLQMIFGNEISFVVATDRDIEAALNRSEDAFVSADAVDDGDLNADRLTELANNAPTVKYLDWLFSKAIETGATDIHIEVLESGPQVRLRINGILVETDAMAPESYEGVVSRLKILAGMDISERRLPQDGRIRQKTGGKAIDIRVASAPTVHGETLVMRFLDNSGGHARLDGLHLPADVRAQLMQALQQPNGLILMTGPTGSGKTTTLHAALAELNDVGRKIVTIENPVEIQTPGLIQIEVKPDLDWTFANALRTVLRHDPDILMVGEIRDAETAELAVRAALTGHLVLSTLHTNKASEAVLRLTDMGVPDYLLSSVLRLVGAQRLVRTLCDHCARPIDVLSDERAAAMMRKLEQSDPALGSVENWTPRAAGRCDKCNNTGYSGRQALFEVLDDVEALATVSGQGPKHRTMGQGGIALFTKGHTTLEELVRVFGAGSFWAS